MNFFERRRAKKQLAKLKNEIRLVRHNDDDLLSIEQKQELDALILDLQKVQLDKAASCMSECALKFNKAVPPYRHRTIRGWLDLLLVVGAVAFGIRALFLQPFRIPTSSMQPTLYGIHYIDAQTTVNPLIGKLPAPLNWLLFSARNAEAKVTAPGKLDIDSFRPAGNALSDSTAFSIGDQTYKLPGVVQKVIEYADLEPGREYKIGDTLADGFLSMGDHLFVERWSIYLASLKRGDIMVFTTEGLSANGRNLAEMSGFFYIKRLVGLPGDTLRIVNNVLEVKPDGETKFRPIYELSPKFEKLYSNKGGYQGHLSGMGELVAYPQQQYTVPKDHYFMMGDNSRFSLDSRFFGAVPRRNLIGKAWVAFWPFSRRWGLIDHTDPVDAPTGEAVKGTYPVMYRQ
ncbi:MAG: signal peptidase I [Victivallales bacterium]|jgi:signal peptidase I|nr:signal peptidase I [Victivallales bacterium]